MTGVQIDAGNGEPERITADFVVDASGRGTRLPRWLEQHGYARPPVADVVIDLTYSTILLERPPDDRRGFLVAPSADRPRGGTAVPVEDGRWMVTLFGFHDEQPPDDPADVSQWAHALPTTELAELTETFATVSNGVHRYSFPSNRWIRYDRLDTFPEGILPLGDAVASFNPIYGQGMTAAAFAGLSLHAALAEDTTTLVRDRYFDDLADMIGTVWRLSVGADFALPGTEGPKPTGTDLFNWYVRRLVATAHEDGIATDALARVLRLEREPLTLLHPAILGRVILPFQ